MYCKFIIQNVNRLMYVYVQIFQGMVNRREIDATVELPVQDLQGKGETLTSEVCSLSYIWITLVHLIVFNLHITLIKK